MKKALLLLLVAVIGYKFLFSGNQLNSDVPHQLKFSTAVVGTGESLPLVIALHGAGANEKDLIPFLESIDGNFRYVSFRAPFPQGMGYTWGEGVGANKREAEDRYLDNFSDAAYSIAEGSAELAERFDSSGAPIVLGFSVGGQMAIYLAGVYPKYFSEIVIAAGVYSESMKEDFESSSRSRVYLYYGKQDPIVPLSMGKKAKDALKDTGRQVIFKEFQGGHTVPPQVAELISKLISER